MRAATPNADPERGTNGEAATSSVARPVLSAAHVENVVPAPPPRVEAAASATAPPVASPVAQPHTPPITPPITPRVPPSVPPHMHELIRTPAPAVRPAREIPAETRVPPPVHKQLLDGAAGWKRPVIGAAALGLMALVLVLGYGYVQEQDKAVAPALVQTQVEPSMPPGQRRDADLKAARACEQRGDWACALRHSESALAADSASEEAKELRKRIALIQLGIDKPPAANEPNAAQGDCAAAVRAGRAALQARQYDQAVARANNVLSALALCPEAEQLKQDAIRAKQNERR